MGRRSSLADSSAAKVYVPKHRDNTSIGACRIKYGNRSYLSIAIIAIITDRYKSYLKKWKYIFVISSYETKSLKTIVNLINKFQKYGSYDKIFGFECDSCISD